MNAQCFMCRRTFTTDRTDAIFCDASCKASYHRAHGASGKHVPLEKLKSKMCEHCGRLFWFNEYADRGGKRSPTYCGATCRKQAWVIKQRAHWEAQREAERNSRSWDYYRQQERAQSAPPPPPPPKQNTTREYDNFRDRLVIPRRWTETDALIWIFGDANQRTLEFINKQCRELNKKYHPDSNGGQTYKHLPTINAAWSHLKAIYKK